MRLIRFGKSSPPGFLSFIRYMSNVIPQENEEYTATPQYPPILDLSYKETVKRKAEKEYNEIKYVKTVEEKQIKLNMPRYYGFKNFMFYEPEILCESLPLTQHVTRTHIITNKDLPEYYENLNVENVEDISKDVQEVILMEVERIKKSHKLKNLKLTEVEVENILSKSIVNGINRVLMSHLSHTHEHIKNIEVDVEPRLEASWVVGGINPDERLKKIRKGHTFFKQFENDPIDRYFGYIGSPMLALRASRPLPFIMSSSEAENPDLEVPFYKYDPRSVGTRIEHRHLANVPGFWPGDANTFGTLSYIKTGHFLKRDTYFIEESEKKEARHVQAILSSYAWLYSQANYLGFTTFNDITYPIVNQTVMTNGKDFQFYIYQLNTILLNNYHISNNPKRNICWASQQLKLYEEIKDDKLIGFNEDVVKLLVKLYINEPQERLGVNLRPYLSDEEQIAADYSDDDKRKWLEKEYKHIVSNRPRHKEMDEVYQWEKIYKIDFNTRPMDKKMRFFELFEKPWKRRLNDRLPEYICRARRPHLPRHKGRYAKDYWP
ncbi:hypothetical protein ABEB36_013598 [Hypothenemus hampei]|uniref:28S ribosomal protein S30, mitochondrial n=1 Tax=Hypothenemus hampei TaxID=57062 RepID=A0ABD1E4P3_HYPHA